VDVYFNHAAAISMLDLYNNEVPNGLNWQIFLIVGKSSIHKNYPHLYQISSMIE